MKTVGHLEIAQGFADFCRRDCMALATEIGIDPTARHGADLGLVPIVVRDASGAGHPKARERALQNLAFLGDAILTDRPTLLPLMAAKA